MCDKQENILLPMIETRLQDADVAVENWLTAEIELFLNDHFDKFVTFAQGYLYLCTNNKNCALSIVSEVYKNIINANSVSFSKGTEDFKINYVYKSIRNQIKTEQKNCPTCAKEEKREGESTRNLYENIDELLDVNSYNPWADIEAEMFLDELISNLDDDEILLFEKYFYKEYTCEEIARIDGITISAAEKSVQRLRNKIIGLKEQKDKRMRFWIPQK